MAGVDRTNAGVLRRCGVDCVTGSQNFESSFASQISSYHVMGGVRGVCALVGGIQICHVCFSTLHTVIDPHKTPVDKARLLHQLLTHTDLSTIFPNSPTS